MRGRADNQGLQASRGRQLGQARRHAGGGAWPRMLHAPPTCRRATFSRPRRPQRKNLASPAFLGMLRDVLRFGREAPEVLRPEHSAQFASMTLGQYLSLKQYGTAFRDYYVAPMCAAVWSVPNAQVRHGRRQGRGCREGGTGSRRDREAVAFLVTHRPSAALPAAPVSALTTRQVLDLPRDHPAALLCHAQLPPSLEAGPCFTAADALCCPPTGSRLPRDYPGALLGQPPPAGPVPAPLLARGVGAQQAVRGSHHRAGRQCCRWW